MEITQKKTKVILIIVIIIIVLMFLFKEDIFRGEKTIPERYTTEVFENTVKTMQTSLSEKELAEINSLVIKAINLLPGDEREVLLELQEKFAYGGYTVLSDDEIATMRRLNIKAMNLLPDAYRERLQYLMYKFSQEPEKNK